MDMDELLRDIDDARRQLGISKTELARLADTQPAAVRRLFSRNGHNPQVATIASLAEVLGHELRIVPKSKEELAMASQRATGSESAAGDLRRLRGGPFSTILADPPWRFANRTGKIAPEYRRMSRYDTMTTAATRALPVSEVTKESAHLYLWVPNAMIADGLRVMESWGFTYKSNIVWAKRRKDGGPDGRGVGFYFRNVTELILFGVKGKHANAGPRSTPGEHDRDPEARALPQTRRAVRHHRSLLAGSVP